MKNQKKRNLKSIYPLVLFVLVISSFFALVPGIIAQDDPIKSNKMLILEDKTSRFSIALGLSTSWILGENPNSTPIFNRDSIAKYYYGGGFSGSQPGIMLKCTYSLDEDSRFVIPFGVDYTMFSTGERVPLPDNIIAWFTNKVNVTAIFAGLDYFFWKIPFNDVRTYLGAEIRTSIIPPGEYTQEFQDRNVDTSLTIKVKTKSQAIRWGGDIKLGVEGELFHPLYLNTSIGLGAINILGRDNNHGELFTPKKSLDNGTETLTYNLYFTLLLQYKF
jgi:hypothetical protein